MPSLCFCIRSVYIYLKSFLLHYSSSSPFFILGELRYLSCSAVPQRFRSQKKKSPPALPSHSTLLCSRCLENQLRPLLKKCSRSFDGNVSPRLSVMTPFTFFISGRPPLAATVTLSGVRQGRETARERKKWWAESLVCSVYFAKSLGRVTFSTVPQMTVTFWSGGVAVSITLASLSKLLHRSQFSGWQTTARVSARCES